MYVCALQKKVEVMFNDRQNRRKRKKEENRRKGIKSLVIVDDLVSLFFIIKSIELLKVIKFPQVVGSFSMNNVVKYNYHR